MSNEITYDQIENLIVNSDVQGNQVHVTFALPGSDEVIEANATIRRSRNVQSQIGRQFKRQAANEVRRGLGRMLRGILGGGMAGRIGRQVVNTATRETTRNVVNLPSKGDKRDAIVEAFKTVSNHFQFDASTGKWMKPTMSPAASNAEPTPFEQQLAKAPVNSKFEKEVLARMLAHAAYADGELSEDEEDFFSASIPAEFGSVNSLAAADPVSKIEAEEIPAGVRENIYMLAWTISSIDMETSPKEVDLLEEYGRTFGLSNERAEELADLARVHVLEGYMHPDIKRSEVQEMGAKIGLNEEEAERALIRWKKRQ